MEWREPCSGKLNLSTGTEQQLIPIKYKNKVVASPTTITQQCDWLPQGSTGRRALGQLGANDVLERRKLDARKAALNGFHNSERTLGAFSLLLAIETGGIKIETLEAEN